MNGRRVFIGQMALGLTGMSLGVEALPRRSIRVAVLGIGTRGSEVLSELYARTRKSRNGVGVEVIAVCDISKKRLQSLHAAHERSPTYSKDYKRSFYLDFQELLRERGDDLDAVFICTPDFCHKLQAEAFLRRGIDVYCELPLCENAASAREMLQVARSARGSLFCPLSIDRSRQYEYVLGNIINGDNLIGDIVNVKSCRTYGCVLRSMHDAEEDVRSFNIRQGWDADERSRLTACGFRTPHEFSRWWQYRRLGLGVIMTRLLDQVVFVQDVLKESPLGVFVVGGILNEGSRVPATAFLDFCKQRKQVLAEVTIMRNSSRNPCYESDDVFGEMGAVHFNQRASRTFVEDSNFGTVDFCGKASQVQHDASMKWQLAAKKGILGEVVDLTDLEMFDALDILEHDQGGSQAQIDALKASYASYKGDRHAWGLPRCVVDAKQYPNIRVSSVERFLDLLASRKLDNGTAERALRAQVTLEGIEKSQINHAYFRFS